MMLAWILIILGATLGVVFWTTSEDYKNAKAPLLKTPQTRRSAPIKIWAYGPDPMPYKQAIEGLQTVYPNRLKLKFFKSQEEMRRSLKNLASRRQLPDLFLSELPELAPFYLDGLLHGIPLKGVSSYEWLGDVFTHFVSGDRLMAYPSEYSLLILYYNRKIFDQVGLSYADTNWNWESLLKIAQTVQRPAGADQQPLYGLEYLPSFEWLNSLACQFQEGLYLGSQWQGAKPEVTSSTLEALKFLLSFHHPQSLCAPWSGAAESTEFLQGNCALCLAGPSLRPRLQDNPQFSWGATLVPRKNQIATPLFARGWAVWEGSDSLEEADQIAQSLANLTAPGWLSAKSRRIEEELTNDYTTIFQVALRYAKGPFTHRDNAKVKEIFNRAIRQAIDLPAPEASQILAQIGEELAPLNLTPPETVPTLSFVAQSPETPA